MAHLVLAGALLLGAVGGGPPPANVDDDVDKTLTFLETAPVTRVEQLGFGLNRPLKVTLEQDGVRLNAVFRTVQRQPRPTSGRRPAIRDHYLFEKAAFELDRLLGLGRVPPTVVRTLDGRRGTLQLWIEDAISAVAVSQDPLRHPFVPLEDTPDVALFDRLIYNFDRHLANALYDPNGYLWLIDHTRSFPPISRLREASEIPQQLPHLVARLQRLPPSTIRAVVGGYLTGAELSALLERRRALLREHRGLEPTVEVAAALAAEATLMTGAALAADHQR